jgi:hypothetical protein
MYISTKIIRFACHASCLWLGFSFNFLTSTKCWTGWSSRVSFKIQGIWTTLTVGSGYIHIFFTRPGMRINYDRQMTQFKVFKHENGGPLLTFMFAGSGEYCSQCRTGTRLSSTGSSWTTSWIWCGAQPFIIVSIIFVIFIFQVPFIKFDIWSINVKINQR